jgi:hypothetical protein
VFALTITLPVVVELYASLGDRYEKAPSVINTFEEDGIERTLVAEDVVLGEMHELSCCTFQYVDVFRFWSQSEKKSDSLCSGFCL